jgi:hypothetical protein
MSYHVRSALFAGFIGMVGCAIGGAFDLYFGLSGPSLF